MSDADYRRRTSRIEALAMSTAPAKSNIYSAMRLLDPDAIEAEIVKVHGQHRALYQNLFSADLIETYSLHLGKRHRAAGRVPAVAPARACRGLFRAGKARRGL